MSRQISTYSVALLFSASLIGLANADNCCCQLCGRSGEACHFTTRTITVPICVTEYQVKNCVVEEPEERDEKYTVFERVPQERVIKKECCYLEPEIKRQEVTTKRCGLIDLPVQSMRKVKIPVTDFVTTGSACAHCGQCGCVCRKTYLAETECQGEKNQPTVVFPESSHVVDYCRLTPKKQTIECAKETTFTLTPIAKTRKVCVAAKKVIKQPVEVTVHKELPKQIVMCEICARKNDTKANRVPRERAEPQPKRTGKTHIEKFREKLGLEKPLWRHLHEVRSLSKTRMVAR